MASILVLKTNEIPELGNPEADPESRIWLHIVYWDVIPGSYLDRAGRRQGLGKTIYICTIDCSCHRQVDLNPTGTL